nr:PREDICTED: stAR-related lipid transfer protein 4 [Rhinolophus sinicus]
MEVLPDATAFATKVQNTLIQYHSIEDDKWRVAKKMKDVTIWRKPSEEFNGYLFKAQGVIDDVVNSVMDHILPGPCRVDWDSLMTSMDILEQFEENCCVLRYTTAGQLWNIISPREFVDLSYTVAYEDGLLSCGVSLDWGEKKPEFVRGSTMDKGANSQEMSENGWKMWTTNVSRKIQDGSTPLVLLSAVSVISGV